MSQKNVAAILDKEIDIKHQVFIRSFNIKTMERYLHVRKEKSIDIISLLDDLWQKSKIA